MACNPPKQYREVKANAASMPLSKDNEGKIMKKSAKVTSPKDKATTMRDRTPNKLSR